MRRKFILVIVLSVTCLLAKAQYISHVIEYTPAPGQYINSSPFGAPEVAKSSIVGKITGSMSLGAFGGYVIFKFDSPVENDPNNPFGIDFTIFGNPQKAYGYDRVTWSEPAVVYVMNDENGNGLPDDTWYELAGSDYFFSSTIRDYSVTYKNPCQNEAADVSWTDNIGGSGTIFVNDFHTQPYYPLTDSFPHIASNEYELGGTLIESRIDSSNHSMLISRGRGFGYADNQIRGNSPYTVPDNPYTQEVENSGGDAFDISWAVDANGNYVDLTEIHFVKVVNCTQACLPVLGEVSTEITGAVDVEPDASITGEMDMLVIRPLPNTIFEAQQLEVFAFHKGRLVPDAQILWESSLSNVQIDENNVLTFTQGGLVTITAILASNPTIQTSISVVLSSGNNIDVDPALNVEVFPNPTSHYFIIKGVKNAQVSIYGMSGQCFTYIERYIEGNPINVETLQRGIYIVVVRTQSGEIRKKLVIV